MNTIEKFRNMRQRRAEVAHERASVRRYAQSATSRAQRDAIIYSNRIM